MSPPAKRLVRTLYVYTFLDEFVLLYPVYALLFTETGLSVAETSSLFVIWSVAGLVLEVPSGALADTRSRRLLLTIGPLLAATGFALWVIFPSYWVFALGFVLWGTRDALTSGSMEALVYEALARTGDTSRYAHIMGRSTAIGAAGSAAAIALAIPVFTFGGYAAVGTASVLACLLTATTALTFPEHRSPTPLTPDTTAHMTATHDSTADETATPAVAAYDTAPHAHATHVGATHPDATHPNATHADATHPNATREVVVGEGDAHGVVAEVDAGERSYWQVLKDGLAEARGDRRVRDALIVLAVVTAVWGALEEYVPFLGTEAGVAETAIPVVVLLVWTGATVGGLLAGRARRLSGVGFGVLLAVGAAALAGGALSGHPAGFVLIAAAFGLFQLADVVADVRLQESITGRSRATVTSVAGLGTNLITLTVYTLYGAASGVLSHGLTFALLSVPYLVTAAWLITGRRAARSPGSAVPR